MKFKEIQIYVEGKSDKDVLAKLLEDVILAASKKGYCIVLSPLEGKEPLIKKGPARAVNILLNKPNSYVFLLPDLYPQNIAFPHTTFEELKKQVEKHFVDELMAKKADNRLRKRFFVHCFKYDMEVLLLASENALLQFLAKATFSRKWKKPVEDQDHGRPPKRVIEELFKDSNKKYRDTKHAPRILENSDYKELAKTCSQNFKPFMNDLLKILEMPLID